MKVIKVQVIVETTAVHCKSLQFLETTNNICTAKRDLFLSTTSMTYRFDGDDAHAQSQQPDR